MTGTGPGAVPRATLRLQFSRDFGFAAATAFVPYFAALGVSHIHASPFLQARAGSPHGYDITDHGWFNPELGDAAAFERLVTALHEHGMGLILDFVPNHMGIGASDNGWWLDVLEWGPASPYAPFFDIDWQPPSPALHGKVLLPFLDDQYGNVLERGALELRFAIGQGTFSIWYGNHRFPVAVQHYPRLLEPVREGLGESGAPLAPIIDGFAALAAAGRADRPVPRQTLRRRQADEWKGRLAALVAVKPAIGKAILRTVDRINGTPGRPDSFKDLHRLLEDQHYRPAFRRVAADEINYRRFFGINDLAGLRIEHPELFELAHRLVFRLIAEGKLQGLRLDHIDGLYDPVGYCEKLQDRAAYLTLQAGLTETAGLDLRHPLYLVVEKTLGYHERLRGDWPVSGTAGYEFMARVHGLFVDPDAEQAMTDSYIRFTGRDGDFDGIVVETRRCILATSLAAELAVVAAALHRLAGQSWTTRDFTLPGVRKALVEVIARFPVYRTYIRPDTQPGRIAAEDRHAIEWAVGRARRHADAADTSVYDFMEAVLTTDLVVQDGQRRYRPADVTAVALRFQQVTGPVMAKSLEDTVSYRYNRLVSLNEVGGEPGRFGTAPAALHHMNHERLHSSPFTMLATATHDHKCGEDTRLRIDALSEMPGAWKRHVRHWARLNRFKTRGIEGRPAPGRNDEYLLYQILLGSWPLNDPDADGRVPDDYIDRIRAYMVKAVREARQCSSWASPNADYEDALEQFVRAILDAGRGAHFLADFRPFQARVAVIGAVNGLAQTLLKLTVPGVPDLYQGTEWWDLSLVAPDNRRPVDWASRAAALETLPGPQGAGTLAETWRDGRIKQYVIVRVLELRSRWPVLFATGDYVPVEGSGAQAGRVVAFLRRHKGAVMLVVVPRLVAALLGDAAIPRLPAEAWGDTVLRLPGLPGIATLTDHLTGAAHPVRDDRRLPVAQLLGTLPVAILTGGLEGGGLEGGEG